MMTTGEVVAYVIDVIHQLQTLQAITYANRAVNR